MGEPHQFILLSLGALSERKMPKDTTCFFDFWFHGAHPLTGRIIDGKKEISMDNLEAQLNIIEDVPGSQAEIAFCSTKCARKFFAIAIDALEANIKKRRKP